MAAIACGAGRRQLGCRDAHQRPACPHLAQRRHQRRDVGVAGGGHLVRLVRRHALRRRRPRDAGGAGPGGAAVRHQRVASGAGAAAPGAQPAAPGLDGRAVVPARVRCAVRAGPVVRAAPRARQPRGGADAGDDAAVRRRTGGAAAEGASRSGAPAGVRADRGGGGRHRRQRGRRRVGGPCRVPGVRPGLGGGDGPAAPIRADGAGCDGADVRVFAGLRAALPAVRRVPVGRGGVGGAGGASRVSGRAGQRGGAAGVQPGGGADRRAGAGLHGAGAGAGDAGGGGCAG